MPQAIPIVALSSPPYVALADETEVAALVNRLPDGAARPVNRQIEDVINRVPLDMQRI